MLNKRILKGKKINNYILELLKENTEKESILVLSDNEAVAKKNNEFTNLDSVKCKTLVLNKEHKILSHGTLLPLLDQRKIKGKTTNSNIYIKSSANDQHNLKVDEPLNQPAQILESTLGKAQNEENIYYPSLNVK